MPLFGSREAGLEFDPSVAQLVLEVIDCPKQGQKIVGGFRQEATW